MAHLPDLLVVHGEWRIARLLRATLQCDRQLLHSFLDLVFQAEPEVAAQAKETVLPDRIKATGEGSKDDLNVKFSADIYRTLYPTICFNNLNVELKDEVKARKEKDQISRYLKQAESDSALVAYIRLDDDPELSEENNEGIRILQHPRYLRPANSSPNFTWADVIEALFHQNDNLRKSWTRSVQVFCEKKVEWTPTFGEIKTAAQKALSLERSFLSRDALAACTDAVCTIYSMNIHRFQREHLKPVLESEIKARGVEATVTVMGRDYNKMTIRLPNRTVHLKWSETLPVGRRNGAKPAIMGVLRAPCNWIDSGDGYVAKSHPTEWVVVTGRPVFPYLSYDTIGALAKAVVAAIW